VAWDIDPLPLSREEERLIIKSRQWRKLNDLHYGEYSVSPCRYDLQWVQRIYWTSYEIKHVLQFISRNPNGNLINDLLGIRNQIYSLSPGYGRKSNLQRKLFSDVFYCLRQCAAVSKTTSNL
jgi:hypothetical protein